MTAGGPIPSLGTPSGQRTSTSNRNVSSLCSTRTNAHRRSAVLAGTSSAPRVPGALTASAVRRHAYTRPPASRPACRTRCLRAGWGRFIRFGRFSSKRTVPVIQPPTRAQARQRMLIANALRPAQPGADAPGSRNSRRQGRKTRNPGAVATATRARRNNPRKPATAGHFQKLRYVAPVTAWRFKLLFDGGCPLCRREVSFLQRRNRHGWLAVEDIAAPGFDPSVYGVAREELMASIHGVFPDGRLVKKVAVFREAYRAIGLGWLVAPTAWPGLRWLSDRGYDWFARNRLRIGKLFGRKCVQGVCALPVAKPPPTDL